MCKNLGEVENKAPYPQRTEEIRKYSAVTCHSAICVFSRLSDDSVTWEEPESKDQRKGEEAGHNSHSSPD